jgi:hypothetical protein
MTCRKIFNVALDSSLLSRKIAETVASYNQTRPFCISERTPWRESKFCNNFYREFNNILGINDSENDFNFIKKINISSDSSMDLELALILSNLSKSDTRLDSYVTLSEHSFNILHSVSYKIIVEIYLHYS